MESVDVIVPCYRYGHFLKECVSSVLAQDGPSVRVLIIDDASPDNTTRIAAELMAADSRVHLLKHDSNRGHITTYNEGIEWASAKYFLLLSADDYLLPDSLQRAVKVMEGNSEVSFVFGNAFEMDQEGTRRISAGVKCRSWNRILSTEEFIRLSGAKNVVTTATAVVRTALQKEIGGYLPELPHAGDMEMWLRLAAQGCVGFIQEPQAVYRRHAANMSLSYMGEYWLRDFEQRKTAIDCFFRTCSGSIPNPIYLRRQLLHLLACEAVGRASSAFSEDKLNLCAQFLDFSVHISPSVRRSVPWMRLACKRLLGIRTWRTVQSLRNNTRRIAD